MADIKKTIEIIFGATDNTGGAISGFWENLNTLEASIGGVTQPLADVTSGLLKTEAAVLALAAAYGVFAISKAVDFQTAQIDLQKVLSETDPALESFTETVINLSEKYGEAANEILQGIANFKQAGFAAEEAAQLQKNALDLVIAGDVEATQATEILIASLKGFGAESTEAARFIEALNNVSNEYATDLGELALGMSKISPIASSMGFSFEEATGLITPVIEVFRSGAEASNALKTGLLKLIDDSAPVGEALEKIGVSQRDVNGEMRSGKDIFLDVATAFQTLDEKQKLVITSQLVGIDQAAKMVVVFDNLAKVQAITSTAMAETGSATKEVELRLKSAQKQIDIAKTSFDNLAVSVGNKLLPSLGGVSGGVTEIIQTLRRIVDEGGLSDLFDSLDAQGEEFGKFLQGIAKALPDAFKDLDLSQLLASFDNLKNSIGDLFGNLDLTKPEDLAQALDSIIGFLSLMTNATAGVAQGLEPLINGIVSLLESLADSDNNTAEFLGNIGGIATAINTLLPALGFLGSALELVGGAFLSVKGLEALGVNLTNLSTRIPVLVTSLGALATTLGSGGLVAAAGAAGFAVGGVLADGIDKVIEKTTGQDGATLGTWIFDILHSGDDPTTPTAFKEVASSAEKLEANLNKASKETKELNALQGLSIKVIDGVVVIVDSLGKTIQGTGKSQDEWNKSTNEMNQVMQQAAEGQRSYNEQLEINKQAAEKAATAQEKYTQSFNLSDVEGIKNAIADAAEENKNWKVEIVDGQKVLTTWGDKVLEAKNALHEKNKALEKSPEATQKAIEAIDKLSESERLAIENTQKTQEVLLNLASDERIKAMEFTADIKVAQIEGDAKRVEAAFESVSDIFGAASDAYASIWDSGPKEGDIFGFDFDRALKNANKRADKSLENATKLNDAQIEYMRARTQSILRGKAKIAINADGLQPELEAVLKSLLNFIQIEANAEGLELLI